MMLQHAFTLSIVLLQVARILAAEKCDGVGPQCSKNCATLGICDSDYIWRPWETCKDGQMCVEKKCSSSPTCPTANPVDNYCSDPNLNMPDIEDCTNYYSCSVNTRYSKGELQSCSSGTFDSCSGTCTNSATCREYERCDGNLGKMLIVPGNSKLAYMCLPGDGTTSYVIYWMTCQKGSFIEVSNTVVCTELLVVNCANGNGTLGSGDGDGDGDGDDDGDEVDGSSDYCPGSGRWPIAGDNCRFRECYGDGTHFDIPCIDGYKYDKETKKCVIGACSRKKSYKEKPATEERLANN